MAPEPPVVGDQRLPDLPDQGHGGTPIGWDFCRTTPLVVAPRAGKDDPRATFGESYFVHGDQPPPPLEPSGRVPELYFYFGQTAAFTDQGLWFDAVRLSGGAAGARFHLYTVDEVCQVPVSLGSYSLEPLLATPRQWLTTCVPLPAGLRAEGLGLRLETPGAEVGIDFFRLGPACPTP